MGQNLPYIDLGADFIPIQVQGATYSVCAISKRGEVKCWGAGGAGQLGYGDTISRGDTSGTMGDNLSVVALGSDFNASQMSTSHAWNRHCIVSSANKMKCWGEYSSGVLGLGDSNNRGDATGEMGDNLPYTDLGTGFNISKVTEGYHHTCALSSHNHMVKCWGENNNGMLGQGDADNRGDNSNEMGDNLNYIDLGTDFYTSDVIAGGYHTCALSYQGRIKCWGQNSAGQLGYEDTNHRGDATGEMGDDLPYVNLGTNFNVSIIAASADGTCALSLTNEIKCWGDNTYGQLGRGDTTNRGDSSGQMGDNLSPIDLGTGFVPIQITGGGGHNCALSSNNDIKCWGRGHLGQLGRGDTNNRGDSSGQMGDNLAVVDIGITNNPTVSPSNNPTKTPTSTPTENPTSTPTDLTNSPSINPTHSPSSDPTTCSPSVNPSINPTNVPTELSSGLSISSINIFGHELEIAYFILALIVICLTVLCCIWNGNRRRQQEFIDLLRKFTATNPNPQIVTISANKNLEAI